MGFGEERVEFIVGAGVAGRGGGGTNTKGLAVPDDGAVIGRDCSVEMCFGLLEDEENILARPPRSFQGLVVLFLLSDRLGRP